MWLWKPRTTASSKALRLDIHGHVSEGSGENIFVIYKGVIYTPPLASSILGGITRDSAITIAKDLGYELQEQAMTREMLYLADEIFFTGTAGGDHTCPLGGPTAGRRWLTRPGHQGDSGAFSSAYVEDDAPDKWGWLTPVA